jgi:hypothetical protein
VTLWNTASGERKGSPLSMWAPDESRVIILYDQCGRHPQGYRPRAAEAPVAFSPDGRMLASATAEEIEKPENGCFGTPQLAARWPR